ncbi:MAG: EF-hand domain-containing protein, partial [Verrucomicrobiales bacterium]
MKTKLTKLAASAITLALLSSSAIAQDEEKKGKKKGKPTAERPESAKPKDPRAQRSPEEALKAIKARLAENEKFAEMFTKRADSDGDGKVSDEEIKAAIAKMGERRKRGEGDRPKGKRPEGDRPKGKRPEGDRPKGKRPEGDRPKGKRPEG